MLTKIFFYSYLTLLLLICHGLVSAQQTCKEIKATIEVIQPGTEEKAYVKIDFKGQSPASLGVFLFGIKGIPKKEIESEQIRNLENGRYLLVFTPKREDEFCIKQIEFTIK